MDEIRKVDITNSAIVTPRRWIPWVEVIYIDVPNLLSLDIFKRNRLRPWAMKVTDNHNIPYVGVLCKIRKKRLVDFLHCMDELRKLVLMCGHNDYDEFCNQYINDDVGDRAEVNVDDGA